MTDAPFRPALDRIDQECRFHPDDLEPLRRLVESRGGEANDPVELFGPWEELAPETRSRIRDLLSRELAGATRWHPSGQAWPWTVNRTLAAASWAGSRGMGRVGSSLSSLGARLWAAPLNLRQKLVRQRRSGRWEEAARPDLLDLLAALGRPSGWLEGAWADRVRLPRRLRGPYHDPRNNVVQGVLTGLDLIPTDDSVWCVEANLNTSFAPEVRRPFLTPEPAVEVVVREALEMGARRIWWVEQDHAPTRTWLMEELGARAREAGLDLRFLESWRVPRGEPRPPGTAPRWYGSGSELEPPPDTLVLRRNALPLGPDRLLSDKGAFIRGLERVFRDRHESRVAVPGMSRHPTVLPELADDGLPNLVYKYPDGGKGTGVHFLRAHDPEYAMRCAREIDARSGEPPGLFQPFVLSRLLPGRRIYDVRCEVFLSPRGVRRVFGLRRESTRSLPTLLGDGVVDDGGAFMSNVSRGGRFAEMEPGEATRVWAAAEAVGEGLLALFERAYEVAP